MTGIQAWYDGTLSATTATDESVTQINDLVNSNHLTVTAAAKSPELGHKASGRHCFLLSGRDACNYFTSAWTVADTHWGAVKVRRGVQSNDQSGSSPLRPILQFGTSEGSQFSIGTKSTNADADEVLYFHDGVTTTETALASWQVGDFITIIYEWQKNDHCTIWIDGVQVIHVTSGLTATASALRIGGDNLAFNERRFSGYFAGAMFGTGALSADERSSVQTYFTLWDSPITKNVIYDWTGVSEEGTDVEASQGVASLGGWNFTTASPNNKLITTFNSSFDKPAAQSHDTSADNGNAHQQVNGMFADSATNKLYVSAMNFPVKPALDWIYEYDVNISTGALTFVQAHSLSAGWSEGITRYNGDWWVVFHDLWQIHQYDSLFNLIKSHPLPTFAPEASLSQGVIVRDDIFYLTLHGENDNSPRIDSFYWDGISFIEALCNIRPPTVDTTQSMFDEGDEIAFAERTNNDHTSNNHFVRATPVSRSMKVG